MKLTLVHAYGVNIEVEKQASPYVMKDMVYLMPDQDDFGRFVKTMYQLEKEKNEWIRRYDNVLKGLRYWESKSREIPINDNVL